MSLHGVAIAALLLVSGCATLGSAALTKPIRVPVIFGPGVPHRSVEWKTADGLTLRGWLFEPEGQAKGDVVFLHGKDINRQHFVGEVKRFTSRGYRVLAYDQRAHGASDGERVTFGFHEVDDLRRGLDLIGAKRVVLIGESLGAAVALQAAAVDQRVIGVVAGASFSDLATIVSEHRPFIFDDAHFAEAVALAEQEAGFRVADISPSRAASQIDVPVMLLHGTSDGYIKPDHARRIMTQLKHGELVWLQGVGHVDVLLHAEAWSVIERWMSRALESGNVEPTHDDGAVLREVRR